MNNSNKIRRSSKIKSNPNNTKLKSQRKNLVQKQEEKGKKKKIMISSTP